MPTRFRPPPPDEPDSQQQDDALRKGLGRAVLWAQRGRLTDHAVLLEACLNDRRFDSQIDECRGEWLWGIIEAAGAKEAVREPLLASLRESLSEEDADQVCALALQYARDHDARFAAAIRDLVSDRRYSSCPWIGEEEIIQLDGEAGLITAARARGIALRDPNEWEVESLVWRADQLLGKDCVRSILAQAAETAVDVKRFYEAWRQYDCQRSCTPKPRSRDEWIREIPVANAIAALESNDRAIRTESGTANLRGWGMSASENDLRMILARLWDCKDPVALANHLWVFSNRALPEFDERLLDLFWHF